MPLAENVYLTDGILPFSLGVFSPRIYLPAGLQSGEQELILRHERAHIRRKDAVFKLLSLAALCLYWMNPLVWLAFSLAMEDMEVSCDEAAVQGLSAAQKADYAALLLRMTAKRGMPQFSLCFGEGNARGRIKRVLRFRKPAAFWCTLAGVCAAALAVVLIITFSPGKTKDTLFGKEYRATETVYLTPLSSNLLETFPRAQLRISDDGVIEKKNPKQDWKTLGSCEPYVLTSDELSSYSFSQSEFLAEIKPKRAYRIVCGPSASCLLFVTEEDQLYFGECRVLTNAVEQPTILLYLYRLEQWESVRK